MTSLLLLFLLVVASGAESAEPQPSREASGLRRAQEITALVSNPASSFEDLFTPYFVSQVPTFRLGELLGSLNAQVGRCVEVVRLERSQSTAPDLGRYRMTCEQGGAIEFDLGVEPAPPHRINAWLIQRVTAAASRGSAAADLAKAREALDRLGAEAGAVMVEIGQGEPVLRLSHNPDQRFLIGSVAKLCTLSVLLDAVEAQQLLWDAVAPLAELDRSLPSGLMGRWPPGTPVTVQTLATLLIMDSDNTANDMLLRLLNALPSRPRIGPCAASSMSTSMTTRQYFVLRSWPELAARHAAGTQAEKQQILRELPASHMPELEQRVRAVLGNPPLTGWTATARELAEVLGHLSRQLRRHSATPARDIFRASAATDPLLAGQAFVAAKGGSDHGVMAFGFIVGAEAEAEAEVKAETGWLIAVMWNGQAAQPPVGYSTAMRSMVSAARRNSQPSEPSNR